MQYLDICKVHKLNHGKIILTVVTCDNNDHITTEDADLADVLRNMPETDLICWISPELLGHKKLSGISVTVNWRFRRTMIHFVKGMHKSLKPGETIPMNSVFWTGMLSGLSIKRGSIKQLSNK